MIIVGDLHNGKIPMRLRNTCRKQSDNGGCLVAASFKVVKRSMLRNIVPPSLIQCITNYELCDLDRSTEIKFYFFVTTRERDHTFPELLSKNTLLALSDPHPSSPFILPRLIDNHFS